MLVLRTAWLCACVLAAAAQERQSPLPDSNLPESPVQTLPVLHSYRDHRWTADENRSLESVRFRTIGTANLYIECNDKGRNAASLPAVRFSPDLGNRSISGFAEPRRRPIPWSALPEGSIVANQPVSFFSRYWTILLTGGACLWLAGVHSLLFLNIRRRKQAERALREQRKHLEDLVTSRSAQLESLNTRLRLDILKREETEKALRHSEELLHKTFSSLRDALLIVEAETPIILDANPAATNLFGYTREELVGHSLGLLHVDEAGFLSFRESVLDAVRRTGYLRLKQFTMRRKNGEVFATQHSVMPLYNEAGEPTSWVSVIRDVTEENRKEEKLQRYRRKLRALAAELTVVEARERRAIAAQLHENLGQLLATAKMKIAPLRAAVADPLAGERIGEVQHLVEEALRQTRSLTCQMSPPILYQLGIEAALKWLAENAARQFGVAVRFTRAGESAALDEETSAFLFSAARELLVNVAKHAQACHAQVRLRWLEDCVEVLVSDDGKGFTSHVAADGSGLPESPNGFGIFNIQERAGDLGGRLRLRSEPMKGTTVMVRLPLGGARGVNHEHEHSHSVSR